jgi:hypothetical protein
MRYGADSKLTVKQVMDRAIAFFGPNGRCGLTITEQGPFRIVFAGGGGYVIATAQRAPSGSHIELEVWEFDNEAREFLESLPSGDGWLSRVLGRGRGG